MQTSKMELIHDIVDISWKHSEILNIKEKTQWNISRTKILLLDFAYR